MNCAAGALTLSGQDLSGLSTEQLNALQSQAADYISSIRGQLEKLGVQAPPMPDTPLEELSSEQIQQQIEQITALIDSLKKELAVSATSANNVRNDLANKLQQLQQQEADLQQKRHIIQTRDRMLQLAMEKNAYRKKLIYILISVILAILVGLMIGYAVYRRAGGAPANVGF
jgi:ElaB/YqjD/DUF883 family membrane-anchored ribosome-binding protein